MCVRCSRQGPRWINDVPGFSLSWWSVVVSDSEQGPDDDERRGYPLREPGTEVIGGGEGWA